MERLNLSFRLRRTLGAVTALLLFSLTAIPARAINIHALYTAACQREVGIILDVTDRKVFILNLEGRITPVERYEVIYHVTYPLDIVPVHHVHNPDLVPMAEIRTLRNSDLTVLVRGWPVDFSKDRVSFLSLSGSEVVVDRSRIWKIEFDRTSDQVEFTGRPTSHYEFTHPPAFSSCPAAYSGKGQVSKTSRILRVVPQQILSDPVTIKREMDRLVAGHQEIKKYERDQVFYPVPELFSNVTTLGIWWMTSSRYGSSSNRKNNFAPFLVNESSSGPFGFQSQFQTGSGPIYTSVHDETQTQIFYQFKADYFHFSAMVDPNVLLVGSKYKWAEQDLLADDIRAVESSMLEIGFDYGRLALGLNIGSALEIGARAQGLFERESLSLPRIGLKWHGYKYYLEILGGSNSKGAFEAKLLRANFHWKPSENWKILLSGIRRDLNYDGLASAADEDFLVESSALTLSGVLHYRFKGRYWAGGLLSLERIEQSSGRTGLTDQKDRVFPKAGALVSLSF